MADINEGSVFWNLTVKSDDADKKLKSLSNTVGNLKNLFGLFKISAFVKGLSDISKTLAKITEKQMNYIRVQNVFNKTMGNYISKATEFRNNMESKLGFDPQEIMDSMSTFKRLTQTFGVSEDAAYTMSKNLTQLAADLTLYGYSFEEAMSKLRSGISGTIRPMRALGVSLDKATLQQTLYDAGINRTFDSLTRAQKTELYYYQIMKQTESIQSQLGKTMASPANMTRVLKQEFTQLARAIGSVFIPIAMKIIPVIRAIVQELINLANWLAQGKMKFNINDYIVDMSDGLVDIGDGLEDIEDGANDATRAMNRMLMPFDELNNITFSSKNGSGLGGIGASGSLFEDLPKYDIFKYVSDDINEKVDEVKAKIESMLPVIKGIGIAIASAFAVIKIVEFLKWISDVKTALGNLGITSGMLKTGLGILFTIGGIWAQWQGTKKLLKGDFSIWSILETVAGGAAGAFGIFTILRQAQFKNGLVDLSKTGNQIKFSLGIMLAIASFQTVLDGINKDDIWKKFLGAIALGVSVGTILRGMGGKFLQWSVPIAVAVTFSTFTIESISDAYNAGKIKDEWKAIQSEITALVAGGIGGAFLGGTIGAKVGAIGGPVGIAIGAVGGALIGGITAKIAEMKGVKESAIEVNKLFVSVLENESEEYKKQKEDLDDLINSYDARIDSITKTRDADLLNIQVTESYAHELDNLVDSNGKVIAGAEKRVDFILNELNSALGTEYQLNDGLITSNGEVIGSYNAMKDNIQSLIEKKREEAEATANIELYKEAYTQRQRMLENFNTQYAEKQRLREELQEKEKDGLKKGSDEWRNYQKKINEATTLAEQAYEGWIEANELVTQRGIAAFGQYEQAAETTINNIANNMYQQSFWIPEAIYNALSSNRAAQLVINGVEKMASKIPKTFLKAMEIGSPSKVMYRAAQWIPAGVAEGIDSNIGLVENSMENLTDKIRVDEKDFDFYNGGNLISSINGSISAKTSASLSENAMDSMANATYEGMARALTENNEDYNPQFNVYVGNDKVYSGFGNYQSNESNRYGVKV